MLRSRKYKPSLNEMELDKMRRFVLEEMIKEDPNDKIQYQGICEMLKELDDKNQKIGKAVLEVLSRKQDETNKVVIEEKKRIEKEKKKLSFFEKKKKPEG